MYERGSRERSLTLLRGTRVPPVPSCNSSFPRPCSGMLIGSRLIDRPEGMPRGNSHGTCISLLSLSNFWKYRLINAEQFQKYRRSDIVIINKCSKQTAACDPANTRKTRRVIAFRRPRAIAFMTHFRCLHATSEEERREFGELHPGRKGTCEADLAEMHPQKPPGKSTVIAALARPSLQ